MCPLTRAANLGPMTRIEALTKKQSRFRAQTVSPTRRTERPLGPFDPQVTNEDAP